MHGWMIGIGVVLLVSPVGADRTSNDRSEMEGTQRLAAASEATGVIEGQVSIGPVRSVQRKGEPSQRPYQARIAVLDLTGREVAVVDSDAEGKFRIALPPGTYVLRPESPGLYPRAPEQRITVGLNTVSRVEIVYDSGKR